MSDDRGSRQGGPAVVPVDPSSGVGEVADKPPQAVPRAGRAFPTRLNRSRQRRQIEREALAYHWANVDPEENRLTRPPDTEAVRVRAYWTAEAYTPATIDGLLGGVQRLGWDVARSGEAPIVPWIEKSRSRPSGGSWVNLGTIVGPGADRLGGTRHAPLPDSVDEVVASLFSVGPAITLLILGFILNPEAGLSAHEALKINYRTYIERSKHSDWMLYQNPQNQKQKAFFDEIKRTRMECTTFVRSNLPGSLAMDAKALPGILVLTTQDLVPFSSDQREFRSYQAVTRLESDWRARSSSGLPGWRLSTTWADYEGDDELVLLAGRDRDVRADVDLEMFGGGDHALDHFMSRHLEGLCGRWAILQLIGRYQTRLGNQRDLVSADAKGRTSVRALERIRRSLVDTTMDARIVVADVSHFASENSLYRYVTDWDEFVGQNGDTGEASVLKQWQAATEWQIARLIISQESVAALLAADTNLRGLIASVRLQRVVEWLTVITLLVAIVSLVVAFVRG